MRTPLPPIAAVVGFIDAINHGDIDRLTALMTPDHPAAGPRCVRDGRLALWQITEDTPGQRASLGLLA